MWNNRNLPAAGLAGSGTHYESAGTFEASGAQFHGSTGAGLSAMRLRMDGSQVRCHGVGSRFAKGTVADLEVR